MESEVEKHSMDWKERLRVQENKHAKELSTIREEYERRNLTLKESLKKRCSEVEELRGRLEEARTAREGTLEDMRIQHQSYMCSIRELSEKFDEAQHQLNFMNQGRESCQSELSQELQNATRLLKAKDEEIKGLENEVSMQRTATGNQNELISQIQRQLADSNLKVRKLK
jgi:chromosome segregation ATPase